jgi:hypothetical protein
MAFAFALPAIGTAVLPAIGAVGSGLGAAASGIGGALASGAGALGGALGSIPVIGGTLGGTIGSLGSGLGGSLAALGGGNIGGALSSLGSGIMGAGSNILGGMGGLYTGADKVLGGLLPNIGGAGISPANGYLGSLFKPQGTPTAGGQVFGVNPFDTVDPNPFVAQNAMDTMAKNELIAKGFLPQEGGGLFGMGGKDLLGSVVGGIGKAAEVAKIAQGLGLGGLSDATPGVTQQQVTTRPVVQGEAQKPIILGGGQTPQNQSVQLSPPTSYMPMPVQPVGDPRQADGYTPLPMRSPTVDQALEGLGGPMIAGTSPQAQSLASIYGGGLSSMA